MQMSSDSLSPSLPSPPLMAAVQSQNAAACLAQEPPIWHREIFDGLASALGAVPVLSIARRFGTDLGARFADASDRASLRQDAHAMVSSAGMLGFAALSQAAKSLEAACLDGRDVGPLLARVLVARDSTALCLATL